MPETEVRLRASRTKKKTREREMYLHFSLTAFRAFICSCFSSARFPQFDPCCLHKGALFPLNPSSGVVSGGGGLGDCLWSRRCAALLCALPGGGWRELESWPGLNGGKGCLASMGSASLLKGEWTGEVISPFPTHNAKWIYLVDSQWMAVM